MRRREFISLIGSAAAWPLTAHAQQPKLFGSGSLKLTEPDGKSIYVSVTQINFIRSDTQIPAANTELGLASGKVQWVKETVDEVMSLVKAGQRDELSWVKLTEPDGKLIHVNVSQVTSVRFDTRIPGANAALDFTSGKVHGVREKVDDVMQLIAAIAGQQGKPR